MIFLLKLLGPAGGLSVLFIIVAVLIGAPHGSSRKGGHS